MVHLCAPTRLVAFIVALVVCAEAEHAAELSSPGSTDEIAAIRVAAASFWQEDGSEDETDEQSGSAESEEESSNETKKDESADSASNETKKDETGDSEKDKESFVAKCKKKFDEFKKSVMGMFSSSGLKNWIDACRSWYMILFGNWLKLFGLMGKYDCNKGDCPDGQFENKERSNNGTAAYCYEKCDTREGFSGKRTAQEKKQESKGDKESKKGK
eukprot:gnl/TRDRNA2_/TRDRNA2_92248_c0_seq1.p1 gnl/TRDRNA2_/TRDRNA2_92248_c0~~gnl/TRDRNA2_/TRDRNA2_92248_c0_seq1.p1  ORF type:complete len:215 (+),score=45.46 gnl/TRDRNA2_/TRDRNA2_92248_c0_seq1:61-705(+)